MRLTSLFIKNFKGIDERGVCIDLAPITMLFGPNNAGKSTIIQALHLAREVLCNDNPDADQLDGGSLSLGGFGNFAHRHNSDCDVSIGLEMELEDGELAAFQNRPMFKDEAFFVMKTQIFNEDNTGTETEKPLNEYAGDMLRRIKKIKVQFTINGYYGGRPYISEYAIYIEDVKIASFNCKKPGALVTFSGLDFSWFLTSEEKERIKAQIQTRLDSETGDPIFLNKKFFNELIDHKTTCESLAPGSTDKMNFDDQTPEPLTFLTAANRGALPFWDRGLQVKKYELLYEGGGQFLSLLMLGPGLLLREFFQKRFQYIGPLRQIPPRDFRTAPVPAPDRLANGLAAWDLLARATEDQFYHVNKWLNGADHLRTGYTLAKYLYFSSKDISFLEAFKGEGAIARGDGKTQLADLINQQKFEISVGLRKEGFIEISPQDAGTGISQVIPVVVAGVLAKNTDSFVAIEQPELHIHPAWQVALGDLFLEAVNNADHPRPMFLLETHSEHLMLRLLRRIRETYENELPEGFQPVEPKMIAVHYVQAKEGGGTEIIPLPVTPDGDFGCKWPNGFFAERAEELF